jgi:tripartite-type tricarboxylate transporter receptor subunit TctC
MRRSIAAFAALLTIGGGALANDVADFYRGKTITVYIGYGPGGGYDLYARLLARHIVKYVPGSPQTLPSNMPGASSLTLANFLAKVAPKDGTAIGAVNSALLFDPLFAGKNSKAQFAGPDMTMIGNMKSSAAVLIAWHESGVKTLDDVREKGLNIATSSPSGDSYLLPLSLKNTLGLDRMKLIVGYPGTREAALALERGEVSGRVMDMESIRANRPDWLRDNKINLVAQLAPRKMPEVPSEVPLVRDFTSNEEDRRVLDLIFLSTVLARPYIAPPALPQDRKQALRAAFMSAIADAEFLAEAKKFQLTIDPMSGDEMEQIIRDAYNLPASTIDKVRKALVTP